MLTEAQFQSQILTAARALGWAAYHTHDSRRSAPGFPDLVLIKDRIVFVEVKTDKGRVKPEQEEWGRRIVAAGGEWYVYRPKHWKEVLETLGAKGG